VVLSIDDVMPWTSVPVVIAAEYKQTGAFEIQRYVEVI
jgi:hypothetical protein